MPGPDQLRPGVTGHIEEDLQDHATNEETGDQVQDGPVYVGEVLGLGNGVLGEVDHGGVLREEDEVEQELPNEGSLPLVGGDVTEPSTDLPGGLCDSCASILPAQLGMLLFNL